MSGSKNHRASNPDDILALSLSAVRREPDADGPSAAALRRTLLAIRQAEGAHSNAILNFTNKVLHMMRTHKTAAAVLMTGSGLISLLVLAFLGSFSSVSYGQVAERIRTAKTMSWTETVSLPGAPATSLKLLYKEPGHLRLEGPGQTVTIIDSAAGKTLLLMPEAKVAQLVTIKAAGQPPRELDLVSEFKRMADEKGTAIGDRRIGSVKAKGFEVPLGGQTASVWADPKTGLPLEVDMSATIAGQATKVVLSDLQFDQDLNDRIFSLTVPSGYTQQSSEMTIPTPGDVEPTVLRVLRVYSKKANGQFPAKLDDLNAFIQLAAGGSTDGKLDPDSQQLMTDVGTLTGLLAMHQKGKDFDYTPGDAHLGDASKMIFWIRGKDGTSFRAIFGDLSVKSVGADEVMKK